MIAMAGAAIARPIGMVRRGFLTSPAMNDIASGPVHAKAIVDQKSRSLICVPGISAAPLMRVAGPNFHHASAPSPISSSVTIQRLDAPMLLSHFPTSRPRMLSTVASVSPTSANPMKYHGEAASAPPLLPLMNSALPAAKYRSAGKYGRLEAQYVQPVMK